jgi:hypothetical protein
MLHRCGVTPASNAGDPQGEGTTTPPESLTITSPFASLPRSSSGEESPPP